MDLTLYQVDAFAERPFEGNPAAIVPLAAFLPDRLMQDIARENNLSETAFVVATGPGRYDLRWFTPEQEVDLCGHATLASAHVLFTRIVPGLTAVTFDTRSGPLGVTRGADGLLTMDFPALPAVPCGDDGPTPAALAQATGGAPPRAVLRAADLMAVHDTAGEVARLRPGPALGPLLAAARARGLIVTAPSDDPAFDVVSRFFAPNHGIPEDPVTGSAHCTLAPYWAERLGRGQIRARQISPRGGTVICTLAGGRVSLAGRCADYMTGTIRL